MRQLPKNATKNHIGYNKHYVKMRRLNKEPNRTMNTLIVKGSLDNLEPSLAFIKTKSILIEHKTDKGYFKKVLVLSDYGKRLLSQKRSSNF